MNDKKSIMTDDLEGLGGTWDVLRQTRAPLTLMPAVMTRVGLADSYFPVETPIGPVFVMYSSRGISAVMPAVEEDGVQRVFQERFGRPAYPSAEPPASLRRAVTEQLSGHRRDLRFDLARLSEFEQAVLRKALEIPRGEVRPYAWIAREIGRPRAVRAVGSALAHNPVPVLIPCHRVVRSDGVIGEYGLGGPSNKRALLEWEGAQPEELEELGKEGIRYFGSDTTKIYCLPTCRHARRVTVRHRQKFHSEDEAVSSGYRPCKVCRPSAIA